MTVQEGIDNFVDAVVDVIKKTINAYKTQESVEGVSFKELKSSSIPAFFLLKRSCIYFDVFLIEKVKNEFDELIATYKENNIAYPCYYTGDCFSYADDNEVPIFPIEVPMMIRNRAAEKGIAISCMARQLSSRAGMYVAFDPQK